MIEIVKLRAPYGYDVDEASAQSTFNTSGASMTQQHFKDETDINKLMRKYGHASLIPAGFRLPEYGDFDGLTDYHSAINAIAQAREGFESLPADLRRKFDNDPGKFVDFVLEPSNRNALIDMKLIEPPAPNQAHVPDNKDLPPAPPAGP